MTAEEYSGGGVMVQQLALMNTNGAAGDTLIPQVLRIQQEYKWDAVDLPVPRRYGPE
jgi:hypothetical protein